MFPSDQFQETISMKEFALMLSPRIGKTGLPEKYHQAIRLAEKFGEFVVVNDNPEYKRREITKDRALEIIEQIRVHKKSGGRQ
jgi:hypothetical protein